MASVMTIDSLDGLSPKRIVRRGLAGAASDHDVLNAQVVVMGQFELMAEAGQLPQATIDSIRSRAERLDAQFDALITPVGFDPAGAGVTPEILERAAAQNPQGWADYMRSTQALFDDVRAIVQRESTLSKVRSAAAFAVGAMVGALIVKRLT